MPAMKAETTPLSESSDPHLAQLVMSGTGPRSEEALQELCRRFEPRVRLYGWKHLRSPHSVSELSQRVMLTVIEKLRSGSVRDPDRIASFILGVARLQTLELRRKARSDVLATEAQTATLVAEPNFSPDSGELDRLSECLSRLPERERSIVVLSFFRDEDTDSIAHTWSTTETHVRVIRHRALGRLRSCMMRREAES